MSLTGEQLRHIRLLKKIKQQAIAHALGISQPAYCRLEKQNRINGTKAQRLLQLLNCTAAELKTLKQLLPAPADE